MFKKYLRYATLAALVALMGALAVAPASFAAATGLGAKGQATLNACDSTSGASGFVKWDVGKLEVNVTIPTMKGQLASLDARYVTSAGTINRLKRDFQLDAGGRGVLKIEGTAIPQGQFARADIINGLAPATDPFGGHVLTTAALPCASAATVPAFSGDRRPARGHRSPCSGPRRKGRSVPASATDYRRRVHRPEAMRAVGVSKRDIAAGWLGSSQRTAAQCSKAAPPPPWARAGSMLDRAERIVPAVEVAPVDGHREGNARRHIATRSSSASTRT
jgi:hypothetical protein